MPQPTKGARLGGSPANERKITANLCKALIENESVTTTFARAKRTQPHMERLITKAKKGDTHNRREIIKVLDSREAAYILIEEIAPQMAEREGGYTRIVKLPNRRGDNAPMAEISLVLEPVNPKPSAKKAAKKAAEEAAAKAEAEEAAVEEAEVEAEEATEEAAAEEAAEGEAEEK